MRYPKNCLRRRNDIDVLPKVIPVSFLFRTSCYNDKKKEVNSALNVKKRRVRLLLAALAAAAALAVGVYVNDYYHAGPDALTALESDAAVTVEELDRKVVFRPAEPWAGLVFYPGGKVEHTAYAPLLRQLAEAGVLCVLPEMPLRLAVLDADAADGIPEQFPEVEDWYLGGHSLGGAMAAGYAADHGTDYEGLVLLAAYAAKDLSGTGLRVLSLYGSEDGVLDLGKYAESRDNLPADTVEQVIDGGCHACFGCYGPQAGDGTPTITEEQQIRIAAEAVLALMQN